MRNAYDVTTRTIANGLHHLGGEALAIAGYDRFLAGKIDAATFQNRLARYWASVPKADGKSAYGQPLGVSVQDIQAAIARSKAEHERLNASP